MEESKVQEISSFEKLIDRERVISFSDAVFAFAITLLVLKIDLPDLGTNLNQSQLHLQLLALWPQYVTNIISFLVIGNYWLIHHRLFSMVKRFDYTFIWINIFLLMSISFLPFPTDVLGDYSSDPIGVAFYAGSMAVTGLLQVLLWWYASIHHHLIDMSLSPRSIKLTMIKNFIPPVIFLVSIPLAFLSPLAAELSWIAIFPLLTYVQNIFGQKDQLT